VFLHKTASPADGKAVWRKCQWRGCSHCGPELRERNLGHDLGNMAGRRVTRRVVARSAWSTVRAKIKAAGGQRVYYPQPGGMLAVYATAGMTGEVVEDLAAALAGDYARIPNGASIRRSKAWSLNPKSGGKRTWKQLGTSAVTDRVPTILGGLGLYRNEVDEVAVPLEAWEVHNFTVPPLQTSAFDRFAFAVGLERSRPGKRRRKAAA
jgi:hypothetical protein